MSGSGRGGENRGNNRRRPFKHRERDNEKKTGDIRRSERNPALLFDRPKWVPPQMSAEPIPQADCPYCGKPIRDISAAIADKNSGVPVHFDCVIARLAEGEMLEPGDAVTYIGGGRFGVVQFPNPQDTRNFKIKKIFEWEDKENRADWRRNISDHYSVV
jgi:hypothetical protein